MLVSRVDLHASDKYVGCRRYSVFSSSKELWAYVLRHRQYYCFYELIPDAALAKSPRYKFYKQKPRVYFDVEYYSQEGPDAQRADRLKLIQSLVSRVLDKPDVDWCVINASRPSKDGKYKNSDHLVARNVYVQDNIQTMLYLLQKMYAAATDDEKDLLAPGGVPIIDVNVYTRNRNMRLLGCRKSQNDGVALRACSGPNFEPEPVFVTPLEAVSYDSLIMGCVDKTKGDLLVLTKTLQDDLPKAPEPLTFDGQPLAKRARLYSASPTIDSTPIKGAKEAEEALQKWLKESPVSAKLNWSAAEVKGFLRPCDGDVSQFIFRVGFGERGRKRRCPAGTVHNGNCGQNWLIKIDLFDKVVEAACFGTQDTTRACAPNTSTGKVKWFRLTQPASHSKGKLVVVTLKKYWK